MKVIILTNFIHKNVFCNYSKNQNSLKIKFTVPQIVGIDF